MNAKFPHWEIFERGNYFLIGQSCLTGIYSYWSQLCVGGGFACICMTWLWYGFTPDVSRRDLCFNSITRKSFPLGKGFNNISSVGNKVPSYSDPNFKHWWIYGGFAGIEKKVFLIFWWYTLKILHGHCSSLRRKCDIKSVVC